MIGNDYDKRILETEITTKKIIYVNKAYFEDGRLEKDYIRMRASLQNIYDNIYIPAKKEGLTKELKFVKAVFKWFDNLNRKYMTSLQDGSKAVIYPDNIHEKIELYFSKAYIKLNGMIGEIL